MLSKARGAWGGALLPSYYPCRLSYNSIGDDLSPTQQVKTVKQTEQLTKSRFIESMVCITHTAAGDHRSS